MSADQSLLPGFRRPGRPSSGVSRSELLRRAQAERRKRLGCITLSVPVSKGLHRKLRGRARRAEKTLQEFVLRALEKVA